MEKSRSIPAWLKPFFWDVDVKQLDLKQHQIFIIERLLNEGDHKALGWLFKTYPIEDIKTVVSTSKKLSLKTARCWQNYFGLSEEEMRCFGRYWISPDRYC
ncbi:DUF6922 domain-containing protein [Desulfitibacter alkalitolerans]|uniref:DUF6922 domain-containing protein n=1 Tax=Desulfitibacter alkalitolerans TaxID=264641 RepID=UPI0005504C01|nr:hypothetical protein [Desulfitibacter alkalitolerans]